MVARPDFPGLTAGARHCPCGSLTPREMGQLELGEGFARNHGRVKVGAWTALRCFASIARPKMKIRLQCAGEYRIGYCPLKAYFPEERETQT
jgi:hypothetical protein